MVSNASRGIQCTHEEDQAHIEGGQSVLGDLVVLLTVHRPQHVVTSS